MHDSKNKKYKIFAKNKIKNKWIFKQLPQIKQVNYSN
jgi:hypothetical protein